MLQVITQGVKQVEIPAATARQVGDRLQEFYLGVKARLVECGQIRPDLAVAMAFETAGGVARMGLLGKSGEAHFVPAIGGGRDHAPGLFARLLSPVACLRSRAALTLSAEAPKMMAMIR